MVHLRHLTDINLSFSSRCGTELCLLASVCWQFTYIYATYAGNISVLQHVGSRTCSPHCDQIYASLCCCFTLMPANQKPWFSLTCKFIAELTIFIVCHLNYCCSLWVNSLFSAMPENIWTKKMDAMYGSRTGLNCRDTSTQNFVCTVWRLVCGKGVGVYAIIHTSDA